MLWDVAQGLQLPTLTIDSPGIGSPVFSPDGGTLAVVEGEMFRGSKVVLWDLSERTRRLELAEGEGLLNPTFSPDGRILATNAIDRTTQSYPTGVVILWDVATGAQLGILRDPDDVAGLGPLAVSPDGSLLAVAWGSDIALWDVAKRSSESARLKGLGRGVLDLAFSPDGRTLASGDILAT